MIWIKFYHPDGRDLGGYTLLGERLFITEVCQKLAGYEDESDRKDRGCFWCKEQIDEFGDSRVTASEITVVSRDRFGKRKLPRNFCPVCGRQLEEELKDETETL